VTVRVRMIVTVPVLATVLVSRCRTALCSRSDQIVVLVPVMMVMVRVLRVVMAHALRCSCCRRRVD
jgi:hypothetical protein